MKKYFEQPELQVVRLNNTDIVTASELQYGGTVDNVEAGSAGRFRDFEDYSY